ncbi:MAG: hypothetical protein HY434_02725 [Candidatus Liptonbacteria bacterium]|nr:hypothetical protein [Candidatus Liptonbacteria bacterium]
MANEHQAMVEKHGDIVAEAGRIAVELLAIRAARGPEGVPQSEELSAREKAMWGAVDALSKSMAAIPEEDRGPLQGELDMLYLTDSFIDMVGDEEKNVGNYVILYLSGKGRLELLRAAKKLGRTSGHPIDRFNQESVEALLRAGLKKFRKPVGATEPKEQASGEAATGFLARLKQRLADSDSKAKASKTRTWDRQSFEKLLGWFERKNVTVGAELRKEFEATAAPKSQQGKAPAKPADQKATLNSRLTEAKARKAKALEVEDGDALKASKAEISQIEAELAKLAEASRPDPRVALNIRLTEAKARKAKALEAEDGDALKASKAEISQLETELAKLTPAAPAVEVKSITPKVKTAATPVAAPTTKTVAPATKPAVAGNGRTKSMEILTFIEGLTDERLAAMYAEIRNLADGGQEMAKSIVSAHEVAKRYDRPKAVARAVELGLVSLS